MDTSFFYLGLKYFIIVLSIAIVIVATKKMAKFFNYEKFPNAINQKYNVSPWFFVKETIDMGYITCMLFWSLGFNSEKELIIMFVILIVISVCAFSPYFIVRREAFVLISETHFEIKLQTLFCGKVAEKISLAQIDGINVLKNKITFCTKDQGAIGIPKNALLVFRGYNNMIEILKSSVDYSVNKGK